MTIGHQYFGQFEDKYVIDAINALTGLKAMFNLPSVEDRDKISEMFYGGEISPKQASFANRDIPRQEAVMKVGKSDPVRVRIPEVKKASVTREQLETYVDKIYRQEWYYDPGELQDKSKARSIYEPPRQKADDSKPPRPGAAADSRTGRKTRVPDKAGQSNKWKRISRNLPVGAEHADEDGGARGD